MRRDFVPVYLITGFLESGKTTLATSILENERYTNGGKVLVLKDSYANAAMQFLMQHYSEITMIDLRYYHLQEKSVSELCREYGVDRVLMLYNMDFINEDRNFVWLE